MTWAAGTQVRILLEKFAREEVQDAATIADYTHAIRMIYEGADA